MYIFRTHPQRIDNSVTRLQSFYYFSSASSLMSDSGSGYSLGAMRLTQALIHAILTKSLVITSSQIFCSLASRDSGIDHPCSTTSHSRFVTECRHEASLTLNKRPVMFWYPFHAFLVHFGFLDSRNVKQLKNFLEATESATHSLPIRLRLTDLRNHFGTKNERHSARTRR